MDSTIVSPTLSSGSAAIDMLAPYILALLIIPLVAWLQKFKFSEVITYQFLEFALWLGCAFGLRAIFYPTMSIEGLIQWSLALLGGSSLLFGGKQTFDKYTKKTNGNTP